jgi:hypothetical protein
VLSEILVFLQTYMFTGNRHNALKSKLAKAREDKLAIAGYFAGELSKEDLDARGIKFHTEGLRGRGN